MIWLSGFKNLRCLIRIKDDDDRSVGKLDRWLIVGRINFLSQVDGRCEVIGFRKSSHRWEGESFVSFRSHRYRLAVFSNLGLAKMDLEIF